MTEDARYLLYGERSFTLASLPAELDQLEFWESLRDELRADGEIDIFTEASGRVLRVIHTQNSVWTSYHYGVHQTRQGNTVTLRLVPQTAWHEKLGWPGEIEPVLAADARPELDGIREMLIRSAGQVLEQ